MSGMGEIPVSTKVKLVELGLELTRSGVPAAGMIGVILSTAVACDDDSRLMLYSLASKIAEEMDSKGIAEPVELGDGYSSVEWGVDQ